MRRLLILCISTISILVLTVSSMAADSSKSKSSSKKRTGIKIKEAFTLSVPERPYREVVMPFKDYDLLSSQVPRRKVSLVYRTGVQVKGSPEGLLTITDYDNGTITQTYRGREIKPIIDKPDCDCDDELWDDAEKLIRANSDTVWVSLMYNRFDIFIDSAYFANNADSLLVFFDRFEPRFDLLESTTGWSSEEYYGDKLSITITPTTGCWGGLAYPAHAHVYLSDPFYKTGCQRPYYDEFDGIPLYGNQGELGDYWTYMSGMMHETTHSVSPLPILSRAWLSEGFARYNEYHVLSSYGDISQETVDTYIHVGSSAYNWVDYMDDDYHDACTNNCLGYPEAEIQDSFGYAITAWMFSMMRDDHGLGFGDFYTLIDNNFETLYFTMGKPYAMKDCLIIDLFGRSVGWGFETETKPIWRYDGPAGPGWGVRDWVDMDWYADLVPELPTSGTTLLSEETLPLTIHNTGAVALENVYTALYANDSLIWSDSLTLADSASTVIDLVHGLPSGAYTLTLTVDEDNIKLEQDETNNSDSMVLVIDCCIPPIRGNVDYNPGDAIDISDLVYLVDYMFSGGPEPPCLSESDIDASGGESPIDISDLVYLVDYMFTGGPAPVSCP